MRQSASAHPPTGEERAGRPEPAQLAEGRRYDKTAKQSWRDTTAGEAVLTDQPRLPVSFPDVEAVLRTDDGTAVDSYICVELKTFDWDLSKNARAVTKRIRAVARQINRYAAEYVERMGTPVQPGVEFSRRPSDPAHLALIEQIMDEECIGVVWMDETIEERKVRDIVPIWETINDSQLRRRVRQYARAIRAQSQESIVYLPRELLRSPRRQTIQDLFEAEGLAVVIGAVLDWALPVPAADEASGGTASTQIGS